jgi:ankyrin repeat protein
MENRLKDIESAVSGTCEWLLQHETFKKWERFNQEVFWIKGKPGSGKSTLLNHAFTNQKLSPSARESDLVLSFFFHGRGGDLQKTPLGFFRSLLHQILKQLPDCLSDLVDSFENKCKEIGKYGEKWQWHPRELWYAFESSVPEILKGRSVWLFVDALDECGEDNAKDLVKKFKLLFKRANALSVGTNHLHICFSCRHYPILGSPGIAEVCLEEENRADICTYVQSELSSSEEQIPSTIQNSIIERASGVFLWAQLVVKQIHKLAIEGAGPNHIKAAVDSLPEDLESLFKELIRGMKPASVRLIQWIHFATRPLSIEELRWAMAIDAGCSSLQTCQNAMDYVPDDKRMRQRIMTLSQGLAEVTLGSRTHIVQFIHQSVKDFFLDKGFLALHDNFVPIKTAIGMSHLYLFNTCIRYLAMEEVEKSTIGTDEPDQMKTDFPFLDYATASWVSHMKQSDDHGVPAEHFLEMLSWPSNDLVGLWTKVSKRMRVYGCPPENTSLVHIVASYGIQGVMNVILQRLSQVTVEADLKDGKGRTPLSLAAEEGHTTIVEVLLATGQVDINSNNKFSQTPLSQATALGHEAVVKLLLATGQADINTKEVYGHTPLSLAVENGYEAVIKLLLATGQADINSNDAFGYTPLLRAASKGHEAVVKLLLATGQADINSNDAFNYTPLFWAAGKGHEAVVKLLLATGQADINLKDNYGQTPLLRAAAAGHEAVVKLLLATGQADINSKDAFNYTPLFWAAEKGHEAVVKLLLATGQAEINLEDDWGQTPLSWAAKKGHEAVVTLLQDYAQSHT